MFENMLDGFFKKSLDLTSCYLTFERFFWLFLTFGTRKEAN